MYYELSNDAAGGDDDDNDESADDDDYDDDDDDDGSRVPKLLTRYRIRFDFKYVSLYSSQCSCPRFVSH